MGVALDSIRRDLRDNMGVSPGDAVEVHSSLRSLGWVDEGPEGVVAALLEVAGTVAMPAFARPSPRIDLRTTPAMVGKVSEAFRTSPGVLRSFHPTHSVTACGPLARHVVAGHPEATALGVDSPLHRLAAAGGWVLHIGCTMTSCSLIHVAEALAGLPYLHIPYPGYEMSITCVSTAGEQRVFEPVEIPGSSSGFMIVGDELDRRGKLLTATVGGATCLKARGSDILDVARELLTEDPAVFLVNRDKDDVNRLRYQALQESARPR